MNPKNPHLITSKILYDSQMIPYYIPVLDFLVYAELAHVNGYYLLPKHVLKYYFYILFSTFCYSHENIQLILEEFLITLSIVSICFYR